MRNEVKSLIKLYREDIKITEKVINKRKQENKEVDILDYVIEFRNKIMGTMLVASVLTNYSGDRALYDEIELATDKIREFLNASSGAGKFVDFDKYVGDQENG